MYLLEYAKKGAIAYAVFLVFAVLAFIFYIVFWACTCSPYLFCVKKEKENEKLKNISYKIVLGTSLIIGLASIAGFYFSMYY